MIPAFSFLPDGNIALPIGISFYTFQLLSYVVDVYRGEVPAQKNVFTLLLYASLFHQCIAGPIVRYRDVSEELLYRKTNLREIGEGVSRFAIGLAKKALLANVCGELADSLLLLKSGTLSAAAIEASDGAALWMSMICYTLQIYLDFSAYSDMAIGMGRMIGLHYKENFNYPYMAKSVREFWRRWHITLSAWFKDYLYIPLGGSRKGNMRTYVNLTIVFFLTGLWHGASWTFVVWGLLHGAFMVFERLGFDKVLDKSFKPLQHLYTLLVVFLAWVFFRADNLSYALHFIGQMFNFAVTSNNASFLLRYVQPSFIVVTIVAIVGSTNVFSLLNEKSKSFVREGSRLMWNTRQICILLGIVGTLLGVTCFLVVGGYNPFIYFRF